jgi:hypothetical protein
MKALILYALFVIVGAVVAAAVGWFAEREISKVAGLLVFLVLFFANFGVSWLCVVLAIDGSLKNMTAAKEQVEVEKSGRASISKRG